MSDYKQYLAGSFNPETGDLDVENMRKEALTKKERCNIMLAGGTGAGKSTLLNAIFGQDVVKAGVGKPVTQLLEKIEIPNKGLVIWDTKGIESKAHQATMAQLKNDIDESFNSAKEVDDYPHLCWLCINSSGARVEERDIELINLFRLKKIPLIVVFTKTCSKQDKEFVEVAKAEIDAAIGIKQCHVAVNSIRYEIDDDLVVNPKGLQQLLDLSYANMHEGREAARNALKKAQMVESQERLNAMVKSAEMAVHTASLAAGTAGGCPIPGSDAPIISAIQVGMVTYINTEFELEPGKSKATAMITGILGVTALAQVGKTVVANLLKLIPGPGTLAGGVISAATAIAITEAIGHAYIKLLSSYYNHETGMVELPENTDVIISTFKTFFVRPSIGGTAKLKL